MGMDQGLLPKALQMAAMLQSLEGVNGHRTFCVCGLKAQNCSQALLIY